MLRFYSFLIWQIIFHPCLALYGRHVENVVGIRQRKTDLPKDRKKTYPELFINKQYILCTISMLNILAKGQKVQFMYHTKLLNIFWKKKRIIMDFFTVEGWMGKIHNLQLCMCKGQKITWSKLCQLLFVLLHRLFVITVCYIDFCKIQ